MPRRGKASGGREKSGRRGDRCHRGFNTPPGNSLTISNDTAVGVGTLRSLENGTPGNPAQVVGWAGYHPFAVVYDQLRVIVA